MMPHVMHAPHFPDLHASPLWAPIWGLLGDFDLSVVDEHIGYRYKSTSCIYTF